MKIKPLRTNIWGLEMTIQSSVGKYWAYALTLALIALFTFLSLVPAVKIDNWVLIWLLLLFSKFQWDSLQKSFLQKCRH